MWEKRQGLHKMKIEKLFATYAGSYRKIGFQKPALCLSKHKPLQLPLLFSMSNTVLPNKLAL